MCRRCFRLKGSSLRDRLKPHVNVVEETWEGTQKNYFWLCLVCCPPVLPGGGPVSSGEDTAGEGVSKAPRRGDAAAAAAGASGPNLKSGSGGALRIGRCAASCALEILTFLPR